MVPRRGRAARLRWGLPAALWVAWGAPLPGCEDQPVPPANPDTTPPTVAIVSPLAEATVADSVAVTIAAEDAAGVARVTLLVDHVTLATRYAPPWVLVWDTSTCDDSSRHTLQVEAVDPAGNLGLSAETAVCVRRNGPPHVEVYWPPDCLWLAADRPAAAWRCGAWDPDEGVLEAEAVTWRLDGKLLSAGGLSLDPPLLAPGDHRLTVVAQDRWSRRGSATRRLTVFEEPGRASPEAAWMSFLCALRARAPEQVGGALAERFCLHAPEDGRDKVTVSGADASLALSTIVADSLLALFVLECGTGPVELFEVSGRPYAKIELQDLTVRIVYQEGTERPQASGSATRSREVRGSAARIFLRAEPGTEGSWRLDAWWDLHGSTWAAGTGPSWTALLREALQRVSGAAPGG